FETPLRPFFTGAKRDSALVPRRACDHWRAPGRPRFAGVGSPPKVGLLPRAPPPDANGIGNARAASARPRPELRPMGRFGRVGAAPVPAPSGQRPAGVGAPVLDARMRRPR